MMNPSSYKKIAVASTFSPRFEQVLSEAGRIRQRLGADLSLIYIGDRSEETAFIKTVPSLSRVREKVHWHPLGGMSIH